MFIKKKIEKGKDILFVTFFEVLKIREISKNIVILLILIRTSSCLINNSYIVFTIIRTMCWSQKGNLNDSYLLIKFK